MSRNRVGVPFLLTIIVPPFLVELLFLWPPESMITGLGYYLLLLTAWAGLLAGIIQITGYGFRELEQTLPELKRQVHLVVDAYEAWNPGQKKAEHLKVAREFRKLKNLSDQRDYLTRLLFQYRQAPKVKRSGFYLSKLDSLETKVLETVVMDLAKSTQDEELRHYIETELQEASPQREVWVEIIFQNGSGEFIENVVRRNSSRFSLLVWQVRELLGNTTTYSGRSK